MPDSRGGDKKSANGNAKGKEAGSGGRSGEVATTRGRRARMRGGVGRTTPRWCARRMSTMRAACGSMCCARATLWSRDALAVDHGGSRSVGLSLEAPPTKKTRVEGAAACGCPSRLQEARSAPEDARSAPDRRTPIATRDRRFRLARGHFERLLQVVAVHRRGVAAHRRDVPDSARVFLPHHPGPARAPAAPVRRRRPPHPPRTGSPRPPKAKTTGEADQRETEQKPTTPSKDAIHLARAPPSS